MPEMSLDNFYFPVAHDACEPRSLVKQGPQGRFLLVCCLSACLIGDALGDLAISAQCQPIVAFFALQTTTIDGVGASYLGESTLKYQRHLKVALMSIHQNCPSIQPVVVSMYPLQKATVAWIHMLGADVLIHKLTFSKDVLKLAELPEYAWVKGVISTYLRTEVLTKPSHLSHSRFPQSLMICNRCIHSGSPNHEGVQPVIGQFSEV